MTAQAFGQQLRRHREKRGISLQKIAAETKVSSSLYRSLEAGECHRWPGGIYSRGYVRAYAVAVGLDPEEIVGRFCECFPEFAPPPLPDLEPEVVEPPRALERLRSAVDAWLRRLDAARR